MTIVLTPVWSNGVQKLKVTSARESLPCPALLFEPFTAVFTARPLLAPTKPARGLLPPAHDDVVHATRCLAQLRSKDKSIEKYIYLAQLKDADQNMFYRLCLANIAVSVAPVLRLGKKTC